MKIKTGMKVMFCMVVVLSLFSIFPDIFSLTTTAPFIKIDVRPSFNINETIFFEYALSSPQSQSIIYTPYITCPNAPVPFKKIKNLHLTANEEVFLSYYGSTIDSSFEPQTCTAYVEILSPVYKKVKKTFYINTNPSFEFEIYACKDEKCDKKSKVFLYEDVVYLNYYSSVLNPKITAKLITPNRKTSVIDFPLPLLAEQIGTYNLEVTASKENYKTITKSLSFSVLEKSPEVQKDFICNSNSQCEIYNGENYGNCPQDCPSGSEDEYCDSIEDGKCDPDCVMGIDPDCTGQTERCGNQNCDLNLGENYGNCPQDCKSGEADGYCDKREDGKCDPDCVEQGISNQDTDCKKEDFSLNKGWNSAYVWFEGNLERAKLKECGNPLVIGLNEDQKLYKEYGDLISGNSYLIRTQKSCSIPVTGSKIIRDKLSLKEGWNFKGTLNGLSFGKIESYCENPLVIGLKGGKLYKENDFLEGKTGYLIRIRKDCEINLV